MAIALLDCLVRFSQSKKMSCYVPYTIVSPTSPFGNAFFAQLQIQPFGHLLVVSFFWDLLNGIGLPPTTVTRREAPSNPKSGFAQKYDTSDPLARKMSNLILPLAES
jgi:hypothetical protein